MSARIRDADRVGEHPLHGRPNDCVEVVRSEPFEVIGREVRDNLELGVVVSLYGVSRALKALPSDRCELAILPYELKVASRVLLSLAAAEEPLRFR